MAVQGGSPGAEAAGTASLVIPLADLDRGDLALGGGKAANLGELAGAGFPVPPGFVITTAAYDEVVASNRLAELIGRQGAVDEGAAIRAGFGRATIPDDLERSILAAYRQLGGAVAVRSSATAEDLPGAAFAGQHETILGVADESGLLEAVRRCWASLWSKRAIDYREQQGYAGTPVKLAVIVQRMVAAEAAGVLFTANPISGARNETVIDASPGLGEAVVSGLVTPDQVVLRRGRLGWRIVERRVGRREIEIRATASGTERVTGAGETTPVLPDPVARRLAKMGEAIARHFGRPQDIEWAWAGGRLFVLQSRPITALPEPAPGASRLRLPRGGPAEYLQIRPYPLDMTSWVPVMGSALQRMFPLGRVLPSLTGLWVEEEGVVTRFAGWPALRVTPALLMVLPRMVPLAWRYDPARWRDDPILPETLAWLRKLESRDCSALTWEALLETARDAMAFPFAVMELRRRYFPRSLFALGALRLLLLLLGEEDRFGDLLSGIDTTTLEANRRLAALADEIRGNPALSQLFARHEATELWEALAGDPTGAAFLAELRAFLGEYGHRETGTPLLVSQPTWTDAPETVLGILKALSLAESSAREDASTWTTACDAVLMHRALRVPAMRQAFLAILATARHFPAVREETHFLLTMALPVLRRVFLEMGRRLTALGGLDSAEEVFHLRFEELERLADPWPPASDVLDAHRDAARQRAARRAALADVPLMELPVLTAATASEALVAGTPGSPGVADGPVRIVRDATAFGTLRPGEVLVAPYTNPSWTPLFRHAAAVVVDTGSAMSHAAIVAREYGIPAVMGTGDAMARLHDGQWVRVDGARGMVFRSERDEAPNVDEGDGQAPPEMMEPTAPLEAQSLELDRGKAP